MEYYSPITNNDKMKFAGKQMELGKFVLSEINSERQTLQVLHSKGYYGTDSEKPSNNEGLREGDT